MRIEWPYGRNFYRHRAFRNARVWSNEALKEIAPAFAGSVINVSAWMDGDKEGGKYRDYFTNATSYTISNYTGDCGATGEEGEIILDLNDETPANLEQAYDIVFNHTTLEHVYDTRTAFSNLCRMSKDAVILIVPFLQPTHITTSYEDYWRFTPQALRRMFADNGMEVIYEASNHPCKSSIYILAVATRYPDRWKGKLPQGRLINKDLGSHMFQTGHLWRRLKNRFAGNKV